LCVFITAVPITKLFAWRGIVEDMCTRDDEPRPVWTSLPIAHDVLDHCLKCVTTVSEPPWRRM
jgi:hypothetical protein